MKDPKEVRFDIADFHANSTQAVRTIEISEQIVAAESKSLINETQIKRAEDWSFLSNQIVGAENY